MLRSEGVAYFCPWTVSGSRLRNPKMNELYSRDYMLRFPVEKRLGLASFGFKVS